MCDSEEFSSYLTNLEEFVFDESKIVSIGWLSRTLQIHISLAKKLLTTFSNDKQFKNKLSTSWFVYGTSIDDELSKKMIIVPHSQLDNFKTKLAKITSQHIYSVQKLTDCVDSNSLYMAEQNSEITQMNNNLSYIQCDKIKIIENRRSVISESAKNSSNKPIISAKSSNSAITNKSVDVIQKSPGISNPIGNMFNKKHEKAKSKDDTVQKIKEEKEDSTTKSDEKIVTSPVKKQSGKKKGSEKGTVNITSFFLKGPLPDLKKSNNAVKKEETKTNPKEELDEVDWMMDVEEPDENKEPSKPIENVDSKKNVDTKAKAQKKTPKETNKPKKNEKRTKKEDTVQQKRKRIQIQSDSSDSEEEQGMDNERSPSPPPPSPPHVEPIMNISDEDEVIPPTPEPTQNGRKRKRKLVSKTMTDESGFLRTVKEFETVSCSDSDGETQSNKQNSEPKAKQETKKLKASETSPLKQTKKPVPKVSPSKSKQTSILSFFTKKS